MTQDDSSGGLWRGQPFYVRLNAGGLLVFALIFIVDGVMFVLRGQPADIVFVVVLVVPTVVIALLALRVGGWALTVAAIWAVLMLLSRLLRLAGARASLLRRARSGQGRPRSRSRSP